MVKRLKVSIILETQLCCHLIAKSCPTPSRPCQAPLSVGFYRQKYWSGLPFPSSGDLPDPGSKPYLLHWQEYSLPLSHFKWPNLPMSLSKTMKAVWQCQKIGPKYMFGFMEWTIFTPDLTTKKALFETLWHSYHCAYAWKFLSQIVSNSNSAGEREKK